MGETLKTPPSIPESVRLTLDGLRSARISNSVMLTRGGTSSRPLRGDGFSGGSSVPRRFYAQTRRYCRDRNPSWH
jgi:hypothetical protein